MQLRPGTISLACARLIVSFAPFSGMMKNTKGDWNKIGSNGKEGK